MQYESQIIELMPSGISKTLAGIKMKYEQERMNLSQVSQNDNNSKEVRDYADQMLKLLPALEAIETSGARFAAQSKMLDIQREKLNLLQQQTAVGRDLASVMQSISQSDASTNLVDMVNSFNDLTKDVKELSLSDIADEIEHDLNAQLDAMNEKYAANAEQIRKITEHHKIMKTDSELELATDDELQGLISANLALDIERNDAIKARKTLLSDEFKEYAAIKGQLDDIKKAYTSINEAGNNLADALSGLTGGDALGGGLKDMLKMSGTLIDLSEKLIGAKVKIAEIDRQNAARVNGNSKSAPGNSARTGWDTLLGKPSLNTKDLGGGGNGKDIAKKAGNIFGTVMASFANPAMLAALLPMLPDIVEVIGQVGKKIGSLMFGESAEDARKWKIESVNALNEILDKRDQILLNRGNMSDALFGERSKQRLTQKYNNTNQATADEFKKKRDDFFWEDLGMNRDAVQRKRDDLTRQEQEQQLLNAEEYQQSMRDLEAENFKRPHAKQAELQKSANDMLQINAALGHNKILKEQADFEDKSINLDQAAVEAKAELIRNGGESNVQAYQLYQSRMAVFEKQAEQNYKDHMENLKQIDEERLQTQRDLSLQSIQLDLNKSDHQKKIAEIRAEEANKQADLDRQRRTADPADYSAIDEAKRLAHLDMLHKLADEARNASEALLALDRSLAATRAALTPDKNDDLKAALDSDLDAIRNAAYEQRRIHARDRDALAKIDEAAHNQSLAKIREFNQQVMANQIEISRRESAIKVSQLEQAGSIEESIRATALGQAQALIDELEALAKTSGRFSQEFVLKSQETQNQIYSLALDQYQKIVDLRRQDLSDFIEIETLKPRATSTSSSLTEWRFRTVPRTKRTLAS